MCNLYLMYFTENENDEMRSCYDETIPNLSKNFPEDSDLTFDELSSKEDPSLSYNNGLQQNDLPIREKKPGAVLRKRRQTYNIPQALPPIMSPNTNNNNPISPQNIAYGYPSYYPPIVPHPHYQPHLNPYLPPPPQVYPYPANINSGVGLNSNVNGEGSDNFSQEPQISEDEESTEADIPSTVVPKRWKTKSIVDIKGFFHENRVKGVIKAPDLLSFDF